MSAMTGLGVKMNCMIGLLVLAVVTGCMPTGDMKRSVGMPERHVKRPVMGDRVSDDIKPPETDFSYINTPKVSPNLKQDDSEVKLPDKKLTIAANAMPLIQFIHMAFREVLHLPYEAGVDVRSRMDPVSMSISEPVDARKMLAMIEETLAIYGVSVIHEGKVWRVVSAKAMGKEIPTIVSGRIRSSIGLGRVMEFIPLKYVTSTELSQLSQYMLGAKREAEMIFLTRLNAVLVVGDANRIKHFREGIALLDRPAFSGSKLLLVRPTYWEAGALRGALAKGLSAEGIPVSSGVRGARGIRLIEIPENNTLIVSSPSRAWLNRAKAWISKLDDPAARGRQTRSYVYFVKNSRAEKIGAIAKEVLAAMRKESAVSKGRRKPGAQIVIDKGENSIMFVGSALQYKSFLKLMGDLDRPRKSVLIQVTVAEVTLNHDMQFGVEWQANNVVAGHGGKLARSTDTLGTLGGLGIGSGGLSYALSSIVGNQVRLKLHALASQGRVKLLSNPTLLALDGEKSRLQVGTQLSIVSQETTTAASNTGVVRTFKMINTGVILNITPIIHEGGIVELKLSQEVSEAGQSTNNTPPIFKRSIQTVLQTKSGQSVLIGGLISHNKSTATSKVPFLGDIPGLGSLFRTQTESDRVTELVVLMTPHVIYQSDDLDYYRQAFKKTMSEDGIKNDF